MDQSLPVRAANPREIGIFVSIVLVLGWLFGNPAATFDIVTGEPVSPGVELGLSLVFALSPIIAAIAVIWRLDAEILTFLRSRFRWRTEARWYLVSLGLLPAFAVISYGGYILFEDPVTVELDTVGLLLLEVLLIGMLFNLIENYGWRGVLQEVVQARGTALVAVLTVGVVWALWHATMFLPEGQFEGISFGLYLLVLTGLSVIIGSVYNSTDGSVLHAAIMHTSFNASFGIIVISMVNAGAPLNGFFLISGLVIWIGAIVTIARTGVMTLRW